MVHAVSTTYLRFEHMSPPAAGLALLLHASVALALYLVSPPKIAESEPPPPIEVTMESPNPQPSPPAPEKPPELAAATPSPPVPPPAAAQPPARPVGPPTNVPLGMVPDDAKTADKPVEAAPPKPSESQQQTAAAPKDTPETAGKPLPEVSAPAAPLSMQDFVRIAPPPPPQEVLSPAPRPPPQPRQQLQQSPLTSHLQHETPQTSPRGMVNPAEQAARIRVMDEYQRAAILKFSRYLPNLREKNEGGTVVVKFSIGRDGRLIDAIIVQSSGVMALDKGMLDAIKAASPYPPLPPEFPGDRATITQSFTARM